VSFPHVPQKFLSNSGSLYTRDNPEEGYGSREYRDTIDVSWRETLSTSLVERDTVTQVRIRNSNARPSTSRSFKVPSLELKNNNFGTLFQIPKRLVSPSEKRSDKRYRYCTTTLDSEETLHTG
jgi:hypothetical protein